MKADDRDNAGQPVLPHGQRQALTSYIQLEDRRSELTDVHSLCNINRQKHSMYSVLITDATRDSPLTGREFDHELNGVTRPLQGKADQAAFMHNQIALFFGDTYLVMHTGHLDIHVAESPEKVLESVSDIMQSRRLNVPVPSAAPLIALAAGLANIEDTDGMNLTLASSQTLAIRSGHVFSAKSFDTTISVAYHLPVSWLDQGLKQVIGFLEEIVGFAHADGKWKIATPKFAQISTDYFDGSAGPDSVVGTALSVVPHKIGCALFKAIRVDIERKAANCNKPRHVAYDPEPNNAACDRLEHAINLLHCARPTYEQYNLNVCDCDVNPADVATHVEDVRNA